MCHALSIVEYFVEYLSPLQDIMEKLKMSNQNNLSKVSQLMVAGLACAYCMLSCFSCVWLCATQWTVACQTPLSMGILQARILEWVAVPPPGDLPNSGIEPASLMSPALTGGFFTTSATWAELAYLLSKLDLYAFKNLCFLFCFSFGWVWLLLKVNCESLIGIVLWWVQNWRVAQV